MITTVTIDDSRPEAKALIAYLRTLQYVDVQDSEPEEPDFGLCHSIEEMDARLDQTLKEMKEGGGMTTEEVFHWIKGTFND